MRPPPSLTHLGLPVGYPFKPDWEATPRQVRDVRVRNPESVLLVDCRTPGEWQTARIEGAVLIPMDSLAQRLDEIEGLAGGKERPIVVHCHHGSRSMRATAMLREAGFRDVKSLAGGIELWAIDIDPSVPRY